MIKLVRAVKILELRRSQRVLVREDKDPSKNRAF